MARKPDAADGTKWPRLWLLRHGETEWSKSGQHTGLTDIPLTEHGEAQARAVRDKLAGVDFTVVLCSPFQRAARTAELAGFGDVTLEPDAHEWDYGDYEGVSSATIHQDHPDWQIWDDGVPNGETIAAVSARADKVISRVLSARRSDSGSNVLLVSHSHFLRVLTARWLHLPPDQGRHFLLDTATISVLGWDKDNPAIERWNA